MADSPKPPAPQRWRPRMDGAAPGRPAPHRLRTLVTVLASMLFLAGALAGLLYWIRKPPRPHFIAVWIDQYTDPHLPPNGWSGQDSQALLNLAWRDTHHFGRQKLDSVRDDLENLRHQSDGSVVVYLSALAISGDDGDVCILPSDARLDSPETWLSLRQVLSDLTTCEARHKLLVLDIMRPFVASRFGVFAADVASRTEKLAEKATASDEKLLVLTACAAGQFALESEDLGHSVFAYYLEQGLVGAADGYSARGRRDGEVTVQELSSFLQARVDRWARQNRAARQTPKLFGTAADFALLPDQQRPPPQEDEAARDDALPPWLHERWQWLEEWRGSSRSRAPVATYRRLQSELLRSERLVRAGKPPETIQSLLARAAAPFAELRKEREAALARTSPRSMAEALAQGQKLPEAAAGELRDTLHELAALEARALVGKAEKEAAEYATARKEFLKRFEKQPFDLAWAVFHTAADEAKPTAERLRTWNGLIASLPPASRPRYAELAYLQRLADWSLRVKEGWPAPLVHLALQSAQAAATAQALELKISTWVDDLRRQAEDRRDEADRLLFGAAAGWSDAESRFTEALALYATVRQHAELLEKSRRRMQDAFVLLPACLPVIENDRAAWEDWKAAAQAARELQAIFHGQPKGSERDAALIKMDLPCRALGGRLHNTLALPLSPDRWKAMIDPPARQRAEAARDMDAWLLRPWLSVDERAKLWNTARALAATLNAETLLQDAAEDHKHQRTDAPVATSSGVLNQEREHASLRADLAIELLKLAGVADVRELERRRSAAGNQPLDDKAWDDLRREVRKTWMRIRQERPDEAND